jgi:replicative DNA helicase
VNQNARTQPFSDHDIPYLHDIERAVLSVMLLEPKSIDTVMRLLDSGCFHFPKHVTVYNAITDLYNNNKHTDVLSLNTHLKQMGKLENIGGEEYVCGIEAEFASTVHLKQYCTDLIAYKQRRELLLLSQSINILSSDETEEVDNIILLSQEKLSRIISSGTGSKSVSNQEAMYMALAEIERLSKLGGKMDGVSTGFTGLDKITDGFKPGELIILAAKTSFGKTALAHDMAISAAKGGVPTAFFSLEMPVLEMALRGVSKESRFNVKEARYKILTPDDWSIISSGCSRQSNIPLHTLNTPAISINKFGAEIKQLIREKKVGFVVVDYLQLMRGNNKEGRRLEVESITRALKQYALDLNIPILALSQLSRQAYNTEGVRPKLSDLRESGSIEQDADIVMFIHHGTDEQKENYKLECDINNRENIVEVMISKQRNGQLGTVLLYWQPHCVKFENLSY